MGYDICLSGNVLEIGGGERPLFHPNMDIRKVDNVDIVHDLEKFPYPFSDESFDGILGMYIIEHISWRKVKDFIKELYRLLKPGGKAVLLTANLLEQCKRVVEAGVNEKTVEMIFGSQEFEPNYLGCHKCGFSPSYAEKLFGDMGFDVKIIAPMPNVYFRGYPVYPSSVTDMIIEAIKPHTSKKKDGLMVKVLRGGENAVEGKRKHYFNREYFESDCQTRGYIHEGYRDFACHYKAAEIVYEYARKHNCKKVLEVGSGRGYVSRILKAKGLDVTCLDISEHCYHTRVVENFVLWDMTQIPWPFKDKEFDLVFSCAVLEHIPEDKVNAVIKEMARVSSCGVHGISTTSPPYDIDDTHQTIKPLEWWQSKFEENCPDNYIYSLMDKEMMESPPCQIPPPDGLKKINLGSFINMFYYGWENVDIIDLSDFAKVNGYIFRQLDVRKGLPYDDNSVDLIFSSHLIEHLTYNEALKLLKECNRVLRDGGVLRIATPHAKFLMKDYLNGKIRQYACINKGVEEAETDLDALIHLLFSGHKSLYDYSKLYNMLKKAGFSKVYRMTPFKSINKVMEDQTFVSHPTISLVVDAVK